MLHLNEQRNFQRLAVEGLVRIQLNDSDVWLEGSCLELSGNGMAVLVGSALEPGTLLQVELLPNGNQLTSLKASAEVIRCESADQQQYRLGLALDNIR